MMAISSTTFAMSAYFLSRSETGQRFQNNICRQLQIVGKMVVAGKVAYQCRSKNHKLNNMKKKKGNVRNLAIYAMPKNHASFFSAASL